MTGKMTLNQFYTFIDKVVDAYKFKNLNDALAWARTSVDKDGGKRLATSISNTYFLKAAIAQTMINASTPNQKYVMIVDCHSKDIKITFGTPSKMALENGLCQY